MIVGDEVYLVVEKRREENGVMVGIRRHLWEGRVVSLGPGRACILVVRENLEPIRFMCFVGLGRVLVSKPMIGLMDVDDAIIVRDYADDAEVYRLWR